ncbi:hypothetical protein [Anatilimnocola floriformis]|uniref:hypothetical protein n=1 Tax=Anatilimnocola floriformis TaxID=2948575 RepID=UPI0020C2BB0D|nr:hypothetical protein [Anatilimnocola floriformis]
MRFPTIHLVGRNLSPELGAVARDLATRAIVYSFETTADLLRAWRLARANDAAECLQASAVVWLQSRSGDFAQAEVDAVQILDPLARCVVVAGSWSEGEPRSGRPLLDATRCYWHQGAAAILSQIAVEETAPLAPHWLAIHAARQLDYQGIAGLCQSLGQRTIWQATYQPAISSEPALRIFCDWSAWQSWCEQTPGEQPSTPAILLQAFPRPDDFERARAAGISAVVAQPCRATDLQQAIAAAIAPAAVIQQIQPQQRIRTAA